MSRHTHTYKDDNDVEWEVVCGYDEPLQEYFLQVYYMEGAEEEYDVDDDGVYFSVASRSTLKRHPRYPEKTLYSNGDILELMHEWECKQEHCEAVALDNPY